MRASVEGKVVLVTGAARGIGFATAERLVADGANVIFHFNTGQQAADAFAAAKGVDRVLAVGADLSQAEGVDSLWDAALGWRGRVDAVVNNAAVLEGATPEVELDEWRRSWRRVLAVNLDAVADLCRHALLHFAEQGGGMIVNVASRAAFRGDLKDAIHYAASKGGVVALTRSIAKSYARDGVLAYVVAPGWVATERVMPKLTAPENAFMIDEIPMGSAAPPEEVANIIAFLLSGQARHATGATIDINGASYFH